MATFIARAEMLRSVMLAGDLRNRADLFTLVALVLAGCGLASTVALSRTTLSESTTAATVVVSPNAVGPVTRDQWYLDDAFHTPVLADATATTLATTNAASHRVTAARDRWYAEQAAGSSAAPAWSQARDRWYRD